MENHIEYEVRVIPTSLKDTDEKLYSCVYPCGEDRSYAVNKYNEIAEKFLKESNEDIVYNVYLFEKTTIYKEVNHENGVIC